jgi:A/G-specific adenine glycosylase
VLVSEFILQQTRMEVGVPRFRSFLRRFPTVASLARAREASVVAEWSGLGYYARARNLHRTAKEIQQRFCGRVPMDVGALRELPGIGPYTAGAIASIAFDQPEPALDGNQLRVLGRLLGVSNDSKRGREQIEAWARQLLQRGSPRALNQALMDLGSSVCTSSAPRCGACPLYDGCATRGAQAPRRRAGVPKPVEYYRAIIHERAGAIWLAPWAEEGPLKGLWMPPMRKTERLPTVDVRHEFSHRTWQVMLTHARRTPQGMGRWVRPSALARLPHSGLTRKLVSLAAVRAKAGTSRRQA